MRSYFKIVIRNNKLLVFDSVIHNMKQKIIAGRVIGTYETEQGALLLNVIPDTVTPGLRYKKNHQVATFIAYYQHILSGDTRAAAQPDTSILGIPCRKFVTHDLGSPGIDIPGFNGFDYVGVADGLPVYTIRVYFAPWRKEELMLYRKVPE